MRSCIFAILFLIIAGTASRPAQACVDNGKLLIYTSQSARVVESLVTAFQRECKGVDVEWVSASTRKLIRLLSVELAEGEPKADIVILSDVNSLASLKRAGHLHPLPGIPVGAFEAGAYDEERTYFGTRLQTVVIVVPEKRDFEAPRSWKQLEASAKNAVLAYPRAVQSIAGNTYLLGILERSDLGWRHLEALSSAGVRANATFGQSVPALLAGQVSIGLSVDILAVRAKLEGAPIEVVFPEDGSPALTEPVAVLSASTHKDVAKDFVEFLLGRAGQTLVSALGSIPVRRDVPSPNGFPNRKDIKTIIPGAWIPPDEMDVIRERYTDLFGLAGAF